MDKLRMETPDLTAQNIDKIAALFPNCITEAADENGHLKRAVNFELLRQMLSDEIVDGDEAYEFTWVGKKAAIVEANKPIRKTLRPCPAESVNWDTTENLYIEGDNLEVLKLLQESYLGKIKMIYIDPPYNTGNDFIYADDFQMGESEYNEELGVRDEEGNRLFKNTDSNGRFHSDWCSMIYSRLLLARNLLSDDGAIFISIDDNECANLIKTCEEVFGADCFVADISWQRTYSMRNDSKGIAAEVEHLIVFSRQIGWEPNKLPRTDEMDAKYKNLDNDPNGAWRNIVASAPNASTHQGMVYAIQNPITGEYAYPPQGRCWALGQEFMLNAMNQWCEYELKDLHDNEKRAVVCGISPEDVKKDVLAIVIKEPLESAKKKAIQKYDNVIPEFFFSQRGNGSLSRKAYISKMGGRPVTNFWPFDETGHTDEASRTLKAMFDGNTVFDTPKPVRLLDRILTIATDKDSLVLDFFSGSATTAHAVMKKNESDGGTRQFILVQLPEKSPSPQYDTLCDVGKERIRRAGAKISEELRVKNAELKGAANNNVQLSFEQNSELLTHNSELDVGFRVFKLDDSNMKDVYYTPAELTQDQLAMLESNIKEDRTDLDLLFGCLLEWGLPLSLGHITEEIDGCKVHTYGLDKEEVEAYLQNSKLFTHNSELLIACFDENIPENVIKAIAKRQPLRAVFRDSSFSGSPEKINVGEIFKLLAPDTRVKVI